MRERRDDRPRTVTPALGAHLCPALGAILCIVAACAAGTARGQEAGLPPALSPSGPPRPEGAVPRSVAASMPVAPLNEEVLSLRGDRGVELEVTLYKPSGGGPFPLAVVNHGANKASDRNRGERHRFALAAYYFLSRGYAVALPMMRGFAGSGGKMMQTACNLYVEARGAGCDIRAVIEALRRRPDIDGRRIVVSGQSFGGWNTLGLGSDPPAGVRGLVLFNAALRSSACPAAEQDRMLIAAAGRLAPGTALPSLWFYGDNDTIMPTATWRAVFDAYRRAGARAELVDVGTVGRDSHQFLGDVANLPLWAPRLDAFLAGAALPSRETRAGYLPAAFPPSTGFAPLAAAAAVPFLDEKGRALYARFLVAPQPRAFVVAPTGTATLTFGTFDPLGKALQQCGQLAEGCRPYAINDEVVWKQGEAGEPTRIVGKTVPRDSATRLGSFFALDKDCSVRERPRFLIGRAPAHGAATLAEDMARPAFPPGSPLNVCNAATAPSTSITYTPRPGYTGDDAMTVVDVDGAGHRRAIRFVIRVR